MKSNSGFTVVELIASFALTLLISAFLFEVLIDVKDVFVQTTIKTNIQQKMGIISKNIKNVIPPIGSSLSCTTSSCSITNNKDGVMTSGIGLSFDSTSVSINGQKFKMPQTVSIDTSNSYFTLVQNSSDKNNCYLKVYLVLKSDNLTRDYIYDVVYYYSTY